MAPRPLDQNGQPQQPTQPNQATPSPTSTSNPLSSPTVVKAGEVMLIISLVLILIVVVTVSIHLYLKRQKRHRRTSPKKKAGKVANGQPELQSKEKKMAELVGTPLCEIGDSEPRHEMEDAEVLERDTMTEPEHPQEHPVHIVSPLTPNYDAGQMFGDMSTRATAQPEAGVYAAYMVR
ncbi:hypothetical protein P171DRAFT_57674 [Karstenula rhodostoma CBS 690.94]|uniref:Uncharacterized protein n=1 Tax=Karstenula rhodostoma CBS 690.94 TaxID=1392251 RepID=A0A9P4U9A0_9PLEO|nr:hypothetical protein P171DRAFT_57674 [Karstenula rhodostoma CBS 690.94]